MAKKEDVKKVLEEALESDVSKKEIEKILKEKSSNIKRDCWPSDIFSLVILPLIVVLLGLSLVFTIATYKNISATSTDEKKAAGEETQTPTVTPTVTPTEDATATAPDYSGDEKLTDEQKLSLSKCLKEKGIKVYFASWCGFCQQQHQAFGDAAWEALEKVQCDTEDGGWAQECTDAGVNGVPTWVLSDGTHLPGRQALETLAEKGGCKL